jgi:hypothetical protein
MRIRRYNMNIINWEDAPEWAIQVCQPKDMSLVQHQFWSDGGTKYSYVKDVVKGTFTHGKGYSRDYKYFTIVGKRPVLSLNTKPVFTQEMEEAGITPPVGSEVRLLEDTGFYSAQHQVAYGEGGGSIVEVVGHAVRPDNSAISVTLFNGKGFVTINPEWVKPLDLRTPKEKAVDNACDGLRQGYNKLVRGMLEELYDLGLLKEGI